MYESLTADALLARMMARVPDSIDKREGSIIYDALMPAAIELKKLYIELDVVMNETFADTATRTYLIKRAAERGLVPYVATAAIVEAHFNIDVPIGSRFNLNSLNYIVTNRVRSGVYQMTCETLGSAANNNIGSLIPIEYIEGLQTAEITEVLILGEDEESTEHFRQRYFDSFHTIAYGGNKSDYKTKVAEIAGVGGVKVYSGAEWNGGGTVKVVITDYEYGVPSDELVDRVQSIIDPIVNSGDGVGVAPIGHFVTIKGANSETIDISCNVVFGNGYSWNRCLEEIRATINEYFTQLNANWQNQEKIIVRIAQIESHILGVDGVLDISDTTLNGSDHNAILDKDSILVLGEVGEP
ncbi:MAG: baseplate J/gp47 family protein [Alphaproteobacteria bacterium]|nr:baseplate J/gp47 family protein [Alphaproteobacteria bacterium]